MRNVILISLLSLAACAGGGQAEEKKYVIAAEADMSIDRYIALCQQARTVAAAYLDEQNASKYGEWKRRADSDCEKAKDPFSH